MNKGMCVDRMAYVMITADQGTTVIQALCKSALEDQSWPTVVEVEGRPLI